MRGEKTNNCHLSSVITVIGQVKFLFCPTLYSVVVCFK